MNTESLRNTTIVLLVSLFTAAQALGAETASAEKKTNPHTRPAAGGVTSLDVYADRAGCIHLLTADDTPGGPVRLRYARSDGATDTWSAGVNVGENQAPPSPVHRGQDAQVAASGKHVVAV